MRNTLFLSVTLVSGAEWQLALPIRLHGNAKAKTEEGGHGMDGRKSSVFRIWLILRQGYLIESESFMSFVVQASAVVQSVSTLE